MWANLPRPRRRTQDRAYKGDITGRRIRTKNFHTKKPDVIVVPRAANRTATPGNKNVYPQSSRTVYRPRIRRPGASSQSSGFVNNYSKRPKRVSRGVSNRSALARLRGLQSPEPGPGKKRIVVPRSASSSFLRRRSINPWANFRRPKKKGERAVTTDIAGRPLRTKNFRTPPREIIPQPNTYGRKGRLSGIPSAKARQRKLSVTRTGRAWNGDVARRRVRGSRVSGWFDRAFKGKKGGYASRSGERRANTPLPVRQPGMGGWGLERYRGFTKNRRGIGNQGEEFTGFIKSRRRAVGGGSVSGRRWNNRGNAIPARTPGIGAKGLGNFQGNLRGKRGFSNQGEEYSGNLKARRRVQGGGSVSGRLWNNRGSAIPARTPGVGARGIGNYQGNIRGRRGFNNQGEEYSGNIKTGRPAKGGGSVSGRLWNNRGSAVPARTPGVGARGIGNYKGNIRGRRGFNNQGEEFSGFIKTSRPAKGGGSVSGRLWNNRGSAIPARTPGVGARGIGNYKGNIRGRRGFNNQGEEFSGFIKTSRPAKGGGSVSGRLWNNKGNAIPARTPGVGVKGIGNYKGNIRGPRIFNNQGEEFTGYIKARKPLKGGGSISGKLWNNKEKPIEVRAPKSEQGGEYAGNLKVKRGYTKNPNSADLALKKRREKTDHLVDGLQIKVGRRKYVENPNTADEALRKLKPTSTTYATGGLQVKVKQRPHGKRKDAVDGTLPGLKPTKETVKASEFARGMKAYRYVRNGSSSREALRVREPGKAFARATDYQGDIKLKKYELFGRRDLHPDAKFMKLNKNNVDGERDFLTNFKLWWARLFKKNDNLPDHLKDKGHKPRYDKGEQGLWYD